MLQKLEIHALRGATRKFSLDFEKGKKITILYGENGSGKSTISDAIELLTKGKAGSLEGKGLGKTEPFWHSTGKKSTDLEVILKTTTGSWTAKLVKSKAIIIPEAGRPQSAILHRGQIQTLIAAPPKNRFDAIRPFLDIETVEESEASLKKLVEQEKVNRDTAVARIEENRVAVENFWKAAESPGANPIVWARTEVAKDVTLLVKEVALLEKLTNAIERVNTEQLRLSHTNEELIKAEHALTVSIKQVEQEQSKLEIKSRDTVDILEAAKSYFQKHVKPETCPLCGSSEYIAGLPHKVDAQLEAIQSFTAALKAQAAANKNLDFSKEQVKKHGEVFRATTDDLAKLVIPAGLPAGLKFPDNLIQSSAKYREINAADQSAVLSAANELAVQAGAFLNGIKTASDVRKEKQGFLQTLKHAVETFDKNYAAQKELDVLIPRLEKVLAEVVAERQKYVDSILGKIAVRVGVLYEAIHPGEGLSKISLLLDPDKRASLDILCQFPNAKDSPPGAYFSDSHLDTLGLCIWLALAELGDAQNIILVLDDVVASVDEPHVDRIIDLLYEIAQKFQHCIITTHYRPWREKYRWGWLQNGQCHFVELLPWQHETGIMHGKCLPPIEELRGLLQAQQPSEQLICASAGVVLEAVLDFLTQLYECSIPRRKGKPTLGDLLPSVKGKLRAALKVERQVTKEDGTISIEEHPLGSILDELEKIAQARNIFGCHFNELAQYLPPQDAIRFAKTVLVLADYIVDLDHGWPRSDKSGSCWMNAKGTRKLHPLKQPA